MVMVMVNVWFLFAFFDSLELFVDGANLREIRLEFRGVDSGYTRESHRWYVFCCWWLVGARGRCGRVWYEPGPYYRWLEEGRDC